MIPILYDYSETKFESNGLGRLSDALSCIVTEARNGEFELEMEYPIDGIHFDDIAISRIICAIPADGKKKQPFDIYSISKPISGKVTIKARHISYRLSKIVALPSAGEVDPCESASEAMLTLKSNAQEECPFDFWSDNTDIGSFALDIPTSIRSKLGGTEGSVLECFGGEYEWDGFTVKLHKQRGSDTGVVLRYGKNITDISQEESIEDTVTGVIPYWSGSTDSGDTATVWGTSVVYSDYVNSYPHHMTTPLDCSEAFQTKPTAEQLKDYAIRYIKSNDIGIPKVNITISFVALWQTEEYKELTALERVNLCDTLKVKFEKLGIDAKAKVIRTTYNVLKDRYDSIEIGNARTNLADAINGTSRDTIARQNRAASFLKQAIIRATNLIKGGLGGHVVVNTDANGEPNEILIMDTDDKNTAVNVIRMNLSGIGFSKNGYNGPFDTAWTIDGAFNADYIAAGTLDASMIKTGILADINGNITWDLQTGAMNAKSLSIDSPSFKLDNDGKLQSINAADNRTIEINNGKITGYKDGAMQAQLDVGNGLFDITNGILAIQGHVGVSGEQSYIKNIRWRALRIPVFKYTSSGTKSSFVKSASLSDGSVTLYGGGVDYVRPTLNIQTQYLTYKDGNGFNQNITVVTGVSIVGGACNYKSPTIQYTKPKLSTKTGEAYTTLPEKTEYEQEFDVPEAGGIVRGKVSAKYGLIQEIS